MLRYSYLVLVFFSMLSLEASDYKKNTLKQSIALGLMQNGDKCILGVHGDEIYLNPDRIFSIEGKLFIKSDNNDCYNISVLNENKWGYYITTSETIFPLIKCRGCGVSFNPNFLNKGICPRCKTQN